MDVFCSCSHDRFGSLQLEKHRSYSGIHQNRSTMKCGSNFRCQQSAKCYHFHSFHFCWFSTSGHVASIRDQRICLSLWRFSPCSDAFVVNVKRPTFSPLGTLRELSRSHSVLKQQLKVIVLDNHLGIQTPRISQGVGWQPHCIQADHVHMKGWPMSVCLAFHSLHTTHLQSKKIEKQNEKRLETRAITDKILCIELMIILNLFKLKFFVQDSFKTSKVYLKFNKFSF